MGIEVTITNDIKNRTKTIQANKRYPIKIFYDKNGVEIKTLYPNGLSEEYKFDGNYNLRELKSAKEHIIYQYNANGEITYKSGTRYSYDAIGQLREANSKKFSYDRAGNRVDGYSKIDKSTNQILKNQTHLFEYDTRGNAKSKRGSQVALGRRFYYIFNDIDQLIILAIIEGKKIVEQYEYAYDGFGRRVKKSYSDMQNPKNNYTHHYLYDRQNIVAIFNARLYVIARVIHHDSKIDTPLYIQTDYGKFYYHRDHQGSIIALSDEYGDIVEKIEYDNHFGAIKRHWKRKDVKTFNPYGFTGREIETDNIYYYRARYYDADIGRFLSRDPIGFLAGDFNFYRYVGNNVVNRKDPFGLEEEDTSMLQWVRNQIPEKGNRAEVDYPILGTFNSIARTIVGKESKYYTKALGMSVDVGVGLAEGTIEGGGFIGTKPSEDGKGIQKVCGTYISFEYRGVLSKGSFESMSKLGQGKTKGEPGVSSAFTFINGTEPPSTVLSGDYRSVTNFLGPFASTTFYTDPDGDGSFDYEVSSSVDVQWFGDWDYGSSMTYGHGEIYEDTCEF